MRCDASLVQGYRSIVLDEWDGGKDRLAIDELKRRISLVVGKWES